ncbi:glycosyltransferase family 2 protein [Methylobacter sp. BBA5.1]|uniref:glycosyltransferase family 2 protein n=1 Tax=Methylobacter sp. BBA5.1 TaxID=1495064 RepID=UPI000689B119|nr:glycosyltransferase family 2 protein [Methylobacter sp. BBA5.1]
MKKKSQPHISIIVLNWNGKEDTLECLASLQAVTYPSFDVIVADNGSTDDSVGVIRKAYPDIHILENGANLGFAEGNNRAMLYALDHGAGAVVILNNDTIVDPNFLQAFNDAYASLPDAGILGATIYYYDQPDVIWAAGANWDFKNHRQNFVCLGLRESSLPDTKPYEVEFVLGCALFVHKELINRIGGMDPLFFLNCEENDWCRRARKNGYKIYSVPDAKIWHKISSSFGGQSPLWKYFITRNQLLWAKRHLSMKEYYYVLTKFIKEFFPLLSISKETGEISLKTIYWGINTWHRQFFNRFYQPYYLALLYGLFHYFSGTYGDCPPKLKARLTHKTN